MTRKLTVVPGVAILLLSFVLCGSSSAVVAQEPFDATSIFQRMLRATHELAYSGVLVYQQGGVSETARLARGIDRTGARERMEILDGAPREIVLANGQIECYLPNLHRVTVEHVLPGRSLLPILPGSAEVAASYRLRSEGSSRVAGRDCDTILLEPRDGFRYAQRYWVDRASGILLKAQIFDEKRVVLEQFAFTQIQVGGAVAPALLRPGYTLSRLGPEWRVDRGGIRAPAPGEASWQVSTAPPGYRMTAELVRGMSRNARVGQIIVSDGVSAISVFIEPARVDETPDPMGVFRTGAFHVFKRRLDAFVVTAVGEAPAISVQAIAEGVVMRQ
jgi:sigma-E factor negative regulatory protein RseB